MLQGLGLVGPCWQVIDALDCDPLDALTGCLELGSEGVVAKRADGRYRPGQRSADWVKLKTPEWRSVRAERRVQGSAHHVEQVRCAGRPLGRGSRVPVGRGGTAAGRCGAAVRGIRVAVRYRCAVRRRDVVGRLWSRHAAGRYSADRATPSP